MTVNLFDVNYYRQANPDLAAAGLTTDEQLTNHFFSFGVFENRSFSRFADLSFYRASNPDLSVIGDNLSLYNHLSTLGVAEGRRFSPFYDTQFYGSANPDLLAAGLSPEGLYDHVQTSVLNNEFRRTSPFFDIQYYRQNYSDLSGLDNATLIEHYKNSGLFEGRKASLFVDVNFYLNYINSYQDLASNVAAVNNNPSLAFRQLQSAGLQQGQRFSPIVDLDFYRDYNPDLALLDNRTLFNQLVLSGSQQGRRLSVSYDPIFYRDANPDLAAAGIGSSEQLLAHFATFGLNEGRQASDSYSPGFYLNANPDLLANGITTPQGALFHYESRGLREGRQANNVPIAFSGTPGTFLGNATNLGAFTSGRSGTLEEAIDNTNPADVYRFTVAAASNVSLQLSNIRAQVNYTLAFDRNFNGTVEPDEVISNAQTNANTNIGGALAEGTYYLIVQQLSANQQTTYRLNLSASGLGGINTSRDPGETAATALDFGVLSDLSSIVEFNEFVGTSDLADVYRFTTTDQGTFSAQVFNISSSVTAEIIIDSNNNGIFEPGETIFTRTGTSRNNILINNRIPDDQTITFYLRITPTPTTTRGTYTLGYTF